MTHARHYLHHIRTGKALERCDGCGCTIPPHTRIIGRTDGRFFHDEDCARCHPHPTIPTDPKSPT